MTRSSGKYTKASSKICLNLQFQNIKICMLNHRKKSNQRRINTKWLSSNGLVSMPYWETKKIFCFLNCWIWSSVSMISLRTNQSPSMSLYVISKSFKMNMKFCWSTMVLRSNRRRGTSNPRMIWILIRTIRQIFTMNLSWKQAWSSSASVVLLYQIRSHVSSSYLTCFSSSISKACSKLWWFKSHTKIKLQISYNPGRK